MSKNKVKIIKDHAGLKTIKINCLIHLDFTLSNVKVIHSYIDEKHNPEWISVLESPLVDKYYKMYYINFHLDSGQTIHCEYNNRELWEQVGMNAILTLCIIFSMSMMLYYAVKYLYDLFREWK